MFAQHDVSIADPATFAASKVIKGLRDDSRRVAKRQYEEGPGAFAPNLDHLDDSHLLQKKRKKVVSAYVSRFSSRAYDDSLPQAVADSLDELQAMRRKRDAIARENVMLAAEIDRLTALRNGYRPCIKSEATEVASTSFEEFPENPSPSWNDRVDIAFSSKRDESEFLSSRSAVTEPVTPTPGPTLQSHSYFAAHLNSNPEPLDFCSEYGEDESVVSDEFTPLKASGNMAWQAVTGSSEWALPLSDLMADDSFTLTA